MNENEIGRGNRMGSLDSSGNHVTTNKNVPKYSVPIGDKSKKEAHHSIHELDQDLIF